MITYSTHASHALGEPDLIRLGDAGLHVLRFETMKIFSAREAVRHLLDAERIAPGATVIDSSSGIYAHALALACHEFGLHCHIVGSTTIDPILSAQLRILGVTLEQMPPSTSLKLDQDRRVARIHELLEEHPDWHWMQQYHSPEHYLGYQQIGADIAELLGSEGYESVQLIAPVGSGASSAGVSRGIEAAGMPVELTGVQPFGSVTFGSEHVSDPDMLIAGIGSSITFRNVRHELYRRIHWISFEVGRAGAVELLAKHGLFAGLSTGASFAVAGHALGSGRCESRTQAATLFLAPDTGHRYHEAVFADTSAVRPLAEYAPYNANAAELQLPWSYRTFPAADARG